MINCEFEATSASADDTDADLLWRLIHYLKDVGKTFKMTYNGRTATGSVSTTYSTDELLAKAADHNIQFGLVTH